MLRPHQSADSDHRSASAGRCCLGSAVSPRVRDSLSDSDPCLHLTNRPNGLSTLPRALRRICRGHKSKVMLPTAVNRSRQKQQRKYMNNQQLVFKSRVQNVHMNIRPIIHMQVFPPHGYLFTAAWCCEGMKTKASTELLDN